VTNARPDWWNGFFDGLMAEFWRAVIPDEATGEEVDFLERALALGKAARVLDAPCGHGRHSLELARRGYRVTGVDWGDDLLAAARASSEKQGLAIGWEKRDMRSLAFDGDFDAAFCAGMTMGFCSRLAVIAVSTNPGFTVTTFTPWRATRFRSASSHVVSPALLVEYAGNVRRPRSPAMLESPRIVPVRRASNMAATGVVHAIAPSRFTSISARSRVKSYSLSAGLCMMPAA